MGYPEALIGAFNVIQVLGLAYLAFRQQQVKKDLNGSTDDVQKQLIELHELMARRARVSPVRAYGEMPSDPPA